jgi:xanthine dehydrogenase accessory factor
VVAVQRPTSARPGARGIIHPDGSIEGWVGGSCAQPIVIREALRSLADGQPRLLRLSRTPPSDSRRGDGIIEYVMACHSGGTLEIYVEPQLPSAALWVVGTTPIAQALASLGSAMGHRVAVVDPVADPAAFPGAERVISEAGFEHLAGDRRPSIVVATQGSWDEEALVAALALDATYVGLVASPTRATAVRAWLRDEGVSEERIAALRAPAGLDLGAVTPEEIAVSILAELVQVRRGRAPFVAAPGPATLAGAEPAMAEHAAAHMAHGEHPGHAAAGSGDDPAGEIVLVDPVCGMTVDRDSARHLAEHGGVVYAFCSVGCRSRFVRDPGAYIASVDGPGRVDAAGTIGA